MKIETIECMDGPNRTVLRKCVRLPFGISVTWGSSEFKTISVWIGNQNGGIFFGKDHA